MTIDLDSRLGGGTLPSSTDLRTTIDLDAP
jgi:hypothetical protein